MSTTSPAVEVQGIPITFPVRVRDGSAGSAAFAAHADAVMRLLPEGLAPALIAPGTTLAMLAMVDYRDNDLGDYDEAAIVFPCVPGDRPASVLGTAKDAFGGNAGGYIHRLPVDQAFTCAAGRQLWGYPKTVDEVSVQTSDRRARCSWRVDGTFVWELVVPRSTTVPRLPARSLKTYSVLDGQLVATEFRAGGTGARMGFGGSVHLGDHPIADELRSVLRSRRPLWSMWIEHVEASFGEPTPLR